MATILPLSAQRVGLVMSGGGAKGLYHIGVIQALEENEIPIDYVAGTSMGSIIAGLYAAGYSPAEMRSLVTGDAIKSWVSGKIDLRYAHYYRELDTPPSILNFRLNLSKKDKQKDPNKYFTSNNQASHKILQLPSDLISSTQIDIAMAQLFHPASVAAGGDFDKLMVPFLCVASDMVTKEPVVFRSGNLDEAIRCSMSIPLVFRPIEKGEALLYDGGLMNNFPWQYLEEDYHPDHIIGSVCTDNDEKVTPQSSLIDQGLLLMSRPTDYSLPEGANVLIKRKVDAGMLDFDKADKIIKSGYDDTMARIEEIKQTIKSRRSAETVEQKRKEFKKSCPESMVDTVRIEGLNPAQTRYVNGLMSLSVKKNAANRQKTFPQFRDGIYNMLADNDFTMDFPQLNYNEEADIFKPILTIHSKPLAKISIGGNLSSTIYNQVRLGISFQHLDHVLLNGGARVYLGPIYNSVMIGGQMVMNPRSPMFLDLGFVFSQRNTMIGSFGNITSVDNTERHRRRETFGTFSFGWALSNRSILRFSFNGGEDMYDFDQEHVFPSYFTFVGGRLQIERNTLDDKYWPVKGSDLLLSAISIGGADKHRVLTTEGTEQKIRKYERWRKWYGGKIAWKHYFDIPRLRWFSVGYLFEGVCTNHPSFVDDMATQVSLPEFSPTQHTQMMYMPDYHASKYVALGIMPTFSITQNFHVRMGYYSMFRDHEFGIGQWQHIMNMSFAYRTMVGPIDLTITKYGVDNWKNMYITLNFGYLLFAPKSTFY